MPDNRCECIPERGPARKGDLKRLESKTALLLYLNS